MDIPGKQSGGYPPAPSVGIPAAGVNQYYNPAEHLPPPLQVETQGALTPWSTGLCQCCDDVGNCKPPLSIIPFPPRNWEKKKPGCDKRYFLTVAFSRLHHLLVSLRDLRPDRWDHRPGIILWVPSPPKKNQESSVWSKALTFVMGILQPVGWVELCTPSSFAYRGVAACIRASTGPNSGVSTPCRRDHVPTASSTAAANHAPCARNTESWRTAALTWTSVSLLRKINGCLSLCPLCPVNAFMTRIW